MKHALLAAALGTAMATTAHATPTELKLSLDPIGQHQTGVFSQGASEIVAYDATTKRLFKVNAQAATVEALDISDPTHPTLVGTIDATSLGASANSVAVRNGLVAVAIEATNKQEPGVVAFYKASDLSLINKVQVGALPDMLTFTPNGCYLLVANEGEPNADYSVDPEGSISIIRINPGLANLTVKTASFTAYNGKEAELRAQGVRIFGPKASAAQDLEPEYITVSSDSTYAWVSLQEANAFALIDIPRATVLDIQPLGTKNHNLPGNALDASDRDSKINIANWPVQGIYMPDSISSYNYRGDTFIFTANEGDSRAYSGYNEETRVKDLKLDPTAFPNAADLQKDANLGRLRVTLANGDTDGDGDFDELFSFGGRSFSIRNARGQLVYDSGSAFEEIIAQKLPLAFNSNHEANNSFDTRSDDKGPEPEGIALGKIGNTTYAFIGLERIGGIMVYDVSSPYAPKFIDYFNHRNFDVPAQLADKSTNPAVGDLGPEGLTFIPSSISPNKKPLLVVGNEVSGTTTVYQVSFKRVPISK